MLIHYPAPNPHLNLKRATQVCVPSIALEYVKADLKERTHERKEVVFGWHPDPDVDEWEWRSGTLHMNPLARLLTFYVGIVLGHGCVHVSHRLRGAATNVP